MQLVCKICLQNWARYLCNLCFADKQSVELPAQWEDMQEERVKLVNLKPSCQEYLEVQNKFKKTCPSFVIEKVKSYGGGGE